MYCPFRKFTQGITFTRHAEESTPIDGYETVTETDEKFEKCLERECATWDSQNNRCRRTM